MLNNYTQTIFVYLSLFTLVFFLITRSIFVFIVFFFLFMTATLYDSKYKTKFTLTRCYHCPHIIDGLGETFNIKPYRDSTYKWFRENVLEVD